MQFELSRIEKLSSPKVSIIILNYNGRKYIRRCLEAVLATHYENFELILVDNGSTDRSLKIAEQLLNDSRMKIIRSVKNVGFSKGNNIGLASSTGDYVAFVNIDAEVDADWLSEIIPIMAADPKIGAAQPLLVSMSNPDKIDTAGGIMDTFGHGLPSSVGESKQTIDIDRFSEIPFASGAALVVKRKILERIGSFDDLYFLQYEDIDLCWRLRLSGYSVVVIPDAIAYHERSAIVKNSKKSNLHFLAMRNYYLTVIKNFNTQSLLRLFPSLTPIALASIVANLALSGRRKLAFDHAKALTWILRTFRSIWKARVEVQSYRKVDDAVLTKIMKKRSATNYLRFLVMLARQGSYRAREFYLKEHYLKK